MTLAAEGRRGHPCGQGAPAKILKRSVGAAASFASPKALSLPGDPHHPTIQQRKGECWPGKGLPDQDQLGSMPRLNGSVTHSWVNRLHAPPGCGGKSSFLRPQPSSCFLRMQPLIPALQSWRTSRKWVRLIVSHAEVRSHPAHIHTPWIVSISCFFPPTLTSAAFPGFPKQLVTSFSVFPSYSEATVSL